MFKKGDVVICIDKDAYFTCFARVDYLAKGVIERTSRGFLDVRFSKDVVYWMNPNQLIKANKFKSKLGRLFYESSNNSLDRR